MEARGLMTAIVLAGGAGRRLGRDKLLEEVGGRPLLQRAIDRLDQVSQAILVVMAPGQPRPPLRAARARIDFTTDIHPGTGVIGGIYTGLSASGALHNLVVAADMPFLNPRLLSYLMSAAPGFDVVMPRIAGLIHPLHAVYSRDCLPAIREEVEKGGRQVRAILDRVRVKYVEEAEIDAMDARYLSFFNVNTLGDLEEARRIAATLVDTEGSAG